jgi:hypothetical protein
MVDEKPAFISGYMCLAQNEYPFLVKYNDELLKYLESGKKIKLKDCREFFIKEGEKDESE